MNSACIIVNMGHDLAPDRFGNLSVIAPQNKPSYVHADIESARQEALRLHKKHGGPCGRFVIFQAVEQTEWRTPFEIAAEAVAALEPVNRPAAKIAEKPKRRRKKA